MLTCRRDDRSHAPWYRELGRDPILALLAVPVHVHDPSPSLGTEGARICRFAWEMASLTNYAEEETVFSWEICFVLACVGSLDPLTALVDTDHRHF